MEFDPGPPSAIQTLFEQAPLAAYESLPTRFRLVWGPIYYRGRTDGSARVIIVGQDPAADENIARRTLVGTAGQRLQGYLRKLGLTRSYVIVNSLLYSIVGQFDTQMRSFVDQPAVSAWRNQLFDALLTPSTEAILAFGNGAKHVVSKWPGAAALKAQGRVFELIHMTAQPTSAVLTNWSGKLAAIAAKVAPDPDGQRDLTPYVGPTFKKTDLERIPMRDLAFGAPIWMGSGDMGRRINKSGTLPQLAKTGTSIAVTPTGLLG
jgi:uracil-DNA glycosylase